MSNVTHQFDAFLSYSHAADGRLAPALQNTLQVFSNPCVRAKSGNLGERDTLDSIARELTRKRLSMRSDQDTRPTVGVFLASGQEFFTVRSQFEQMINRLSYLPHIARSYKLTPVHWQQGGGDTQGKPLQKQIESSVHLQEVPIVLVLIGSYIGPGTREEYETAVSLRRRHGAWPKILVFFKCLDDGVSLVGNENVPC